MDEQDRICNIPRNLNEADVLNIGLGIKLRMVDLPFLAAGGTYSYFLTAGPGPVLLKFAAFGAIMSISYLTSKFTIEDKPLPNVCVDGVVYTAHQVKYAKRRKELGYESPRENN